MQLIGGLQEIATEGEMEREKCFVKQRNIWWFYRSLGGSEGRQLDYLEEV